MRQVEEAERNAGFFDEVVENVAQGDPSAFTLRALDGHALQELS